MSSTNEEIPAPPKKQSPLEFRNTDLVSRLLAATPPYLYNMPLVPHSYFFSEMLRSLVQSKSEAAARIPSSIPHRRSRKRSWSHARTDHFNPKQMSPNVKCDNPEMPPPNWTPKLPEKQEIFDGKSLERPLELTMNKIPMNSNSKLCHTETQPSEIRNDALSPHRLNMGSNPMLSGDKPEMHSLPPSGHVPMTFPPLPNLTPPETSTSSTDLILPPPPPIWYPPLYPTPYGIDPLHFFIDLRVSGHIYDRKNSKEHSNLNMNLPPHTTSSQMNQLGLGTPMNMNHLLDVNSTNATSTITSSSIPEHNFNINKESVVKQSRHASAFTVPIPSMGRNDPINLSGNKYSHSKFPRFGNEKPAKFDIKSMGFDRGFEVNSDNSKSTNYILKNLSRIYKDVNEMKHEEEGIDLTSPKQEVEQKEEEVNVKDETEDSKEDDKEGEKAKKCKDLRALIGLELVVDYVKHEVKPGKPSSSEDGSLTDVESNISSISSPAVEILTIPEIERKINV